MQSIKEGILSLHLWPFPMLDKKNLSCSFHQEARLFRIELEGNLRKITTVSFYTLSQGNPQMTIQVDAPGCPSSSPEKLICRKIARGKSSQGNYYSHHNFHPSECHTLPLFRLHGSMREICKSEFLCQLNCMFSRCQTFTWWFSVFLRGQRDLCH